MVKKQRTFWMEDDDWKRLLQKVKEYFEGKGMVERFMEKIARENIIFFRGEGIVEFKVKPK